MIEQIKCTLARLLNSEGVKGDRRYRTVGHDCKQSSNISLCYCTTTNFVDKVLNYIIVEDNVKSRIQEITQSKFEIKKLAAAKELMTLIEDEKRQPINVQSLL